MEQIAYLLVIVGALWRIVRMIEQIKVDRRMDAYRKEFDEARQKRIDKESR